MERIREKKDGIPKPWLYDLGKGVFRALSVASRISTSGVENIPREGPVVFATTHRGFSDIPLLGMYADDRRIRFVAKKDLFAVPVVGKVLANTGTIPVSRKIPGQEFFHRVVSILASNDNPAVFMATEGGVRKGNIVSDVQPGLGFIALFTEITIIPTAIAGPEKMPKSPLPNDSHIHFSEPIDVFPLVSYTPDLDLTLSNRNPLYRENTDFIAELSEKVRSDLQVGLDIANQQNSFNTSPDFFYRSMLNDF